MTETADTYNLLGADGLYKTDGRNGLSYLLPAKVVTTLHSHPGDYPDGSHNPLPIPVEGHVHLIVYTPGGVGTKVRTENPEGTEGKTFAPNNDEDYVGAVSLVPGTGTYVELDVPVTTGTIEDMMPRTFKVLRTYPLGE